MTAMVLILAVLVFGVGYPLLALHYQTSRRTRRRQAGGVGSDGGGSGWSSDGGCDAGDGGGDGGGGDGGGGDGGGGGCD